MATSGAQGWDWKPRDSKAGGLLYQSGNWGDLLKVLWLTEIVKWKMARNGELKYFDPFAGAVKYPMDRKTRFRFAQAALPSLGYLKNGFVDKGCWPSSASAVRMLTGGRLVVYDADTVRRAEWEASGQVEVADGDSGWSILAARAPSPDELWLVDPYDFLSEWRDRLLMLAEKARSVTVLVYMYNRSARTEEAFRNYKAFRNAMADLRGDAPYRLGRAASDAFLPRAHHEMILLPGRRDRERDDFARLSGVLESRTMELSAAIGRAGVFDA